MSDPLKTFLERARDGGWKYAKYYFFGNKYNASISEREITAIIFDPEAAKAVWGEPGWRVPFADIEHVWVLESTRNDTEQTKIYRCDVGEKYSKCSAEKEGDTVYHDDCDGSRTEGEPHCYKGFVYAPHGIPRHVGWKHKQSEILSLIQSGVSPLEALAKKL